MLPLLKKKNEPAVATRMPDWHPNFRNYEKLPDIKAVRTVFFINVGGISTVILFLGIVGYQEFNLLSLRRQKEETQAVISRDSRFSQQSISLFRQFQNEEKKNSELDAFIKARPELSRLLIHLGLTLPKNVALSSFELKSQELFLRGIVRGAPELASGTANSYEAQLRKDKTLAAFFEDVSVTSLNRDALTGRLLFELRLKLKTDKPGTK
jgi:hypothetical protein